jgi:hypothetical protein
MSLSFWNQRRRNAAAILRMREEAAKAKEAEEAANIEETAEPEKTQTKRGRKNADSGANSES